MRYDLVNLDTYFSSNEYICGMKHLGFLLIIICTCSCAVNAQTLKHGLGVHFGGVDYYGPQTGIYFAKQTDTKLNTIKLYWDPAIKLSFTERISSLFDISLSAMASSLQYPKSSKDSNYILRKKGMGNTNESFPKVAFDAKFNLNLLPRERWAVSPYLTSGISLSNRQSLTGFDLPFGAGMNVKLTQSVFVNLESLYKMPLSTSIQKHLFHSLGLVYWWGEKKVRQEEIPKVQQPLAIIIQDKDNDGVPDTDDKCPDVPGKKTMYGCPDSDGDGYRDDEDKCPQDAGVARFNGCPVPDRDNDGFNDEEDECPDEAFEDNNGCPYIKKEIRQKVDLAAKGIYFKTNSAEIDSMSLKNLDEIAVIMQGQAAFMLDIEGHTDNKGNADLNLKLSQQRADACKAYLVQKGISDSRIESTGFGDMKPIADNETEEGRAKNRRTEFMLKMTE
jgi:outer membrane protein OmpA-like peptidoglycan-associated protein